MPKRYKIDANISKTHRGIKETMVALSAADVISVLKLAVEIDTPPESTVEKTSISFKCCVSDKQCVLNTNGEP